jgi:hypothetical protein
MGAVASGGAVGEHLERLEERFGSFPVDQTTIAVGASTYDRERERTDAGVVDAIVRVWNDDGDVLHVQRDDEWRLPRQRGTSVAELTEAVEREVWSDLAVDCAVEGVSRVTIAGVRNRDDADAETLYRLLVVVDASHATGTPSEGEWRHIEGLTAGGEG